MKHLTRDDLVLRLKSLAKDVCDVTYNRSRPQNKLAGGLSTPSVYTAGSGEERKSKLTRFAKTMFSTGSFAKKNNDEEDLSRVRSFASDAITLTPSFASTTKSPQEYPGKMMSADIVATSRQYHVPGELLPETT
jgi:hypothetical protein